MIKKVVYGSVLSLILSDSSVFGEKLKSIKISGLHRVEEEAVKGYLKIKIGDEIASSRVDESLKRLYETQWFSDVKMSVNGAVLNVDLVENATVNQVAFEGNDSISDDILKAEVQVKSRQVFTTDVIKKETQKILEIYQRKGRYAATVEPKIIKRDQNRVDVVFVIQEGVMTNIGRINFIGAQAFSQSELENEIYSKEARWYRFLTATDTYDPERLQTDMHALKKFYAKNGYIKFEGISSGASLLPDKSGFILTFVVNEGQRYKVKDLKYDIKIPGVDLEKIKQTVDMKSGEWYNGDLVERTKLLLTEKLGDQGYAFVNVDHRIKEIPGTNEVDLTFVVEETSKMYIERIDIIGNVKTLDRVVRREMLLKEGDPFNVTKVKDSLRRIRALGYFKPQAVREERSKGSSSNKMVLKIFVEEEGTMQIKFGVGYNSEDGRGNVFKGFNGQIKLADPNFFGYGINGNLELEKGSRRQNAILGLSDAHFFGYRVGAGFDLFSTDEDRMELEGYTDKRKGLSVYTRYNLSEDFYQRLTYTFYLQKMELGADTKEKVSKHVKEQADGKERKVSKATLYSVYDKRDSLLGADSGYALALTNEFAGLGGDISFFRNEVKALIHFPITEKVIFNLKGKAGLIMADSLRIADHMMLGGESLHGFDVWGIGPRVKKTDSIKDDALGGKKYYTGAAEISIPVGGAELGARFLSYIEIGDLWDSGFKPTSAEDIYNESFMRVSAGFGFAFTIPILGRIRLDYAWPLRSKKYDKESNFLFGMDYRF